ncbi:MAG: hypothetical protein KBD01_14505 [Acidobacteria bacterium]|nr:hypothetical protein [Acidobacteriota bacterium]
MTRPSSTTSAAIGCIAAAGLMFEICLLRIFSFAIWHHFAFMVISVALLGFAVSGVALQLRPRLGQPAEPRAALFMVLFGAAAVLSVALVVRVPFDPTALAKDPREIAVLGLYYLAFVVPFAFAGLAIVTLLEGFAAHAGRLYAADLVAAGGGALLVTPALGWLGAEGIVLLAAAFAGAGAFLSRLGGDPRPARAALPWAGAALLPLALLPWADALIRIPPGPGKALGRAAGEPGARTVFTRWNALARIDVVEGLAPLGWTANESTAVAPPQQLHIYIDGDATTPIVKFDGDLSRLAFADATLPSAADQLVHPDRVLVIGPGGGVDVLTALRHGARQVTAVEINPVIVDLVTGRFADFSGRWAARGDVELVLDEGRSFVRRQDRRFDVIKLSLIDTWAAAASGAYSLSEGYLYTVEAFGDYLDHLADDGLLTITRWDWTPPREVLRVCTVAAEALRRRGAREPAAHVVVLALARMGNVLVKPTPFTPAEMDAIRRLAAARGYLVLAGPGAEVATPFQEYLASDNPRGFVARYPFDVSPTTDDTPFFFQFGRWRSTKLFGPGWRENPLILSGRLVLLAVLLQALVLSVLLLALPRFFSARAAGGAGGEPRRGVIAYFVLVGLAFMLLEISLMQRFTLFLGSPIHAVTVVLATLLVAAGAGSACAARVAHARGGPWLVFVLLAGLGLVHALALPPLLRSALALPFGARVLVAVALLAPLGFLLGFPFPCGLARLERRGAPGLVGLAWAANGCASVVGPVLGTMLALDLGFTSVIVLGSLGYLAAWLAFGGWWEARGRTPTTT